MKTRVLATLIVAAACTTGSPPASQASPTVGAPAPTTAAATAAPATAPAAPPTPGATGREALMALADCRAPATPTVASTEGPYFKAGSPEKASLVTSGMPGTRIQLTGLVLTRACAPVARAKVDIWQADAKGEYDNSGYTLRGHVFTDAQGQYSIETVVPAPYSGRTPHVHVKVTPPTGATLTTQLYFPDSAQNASDGIFRKELVMRVTSEPRTTGLFVFVLDLP